MLETAVGRYSQNGEDGLILDFFGATKGCFLDIGAWHPTDLSNTRRLVEAGWSGVLIEPSPQAFMALLTACVGCGRSRSEDHKCGNFADVCRCGGSEIYGSSERFRLILGALASDRTCQPFYASDSPLGTTITSQMEARKAEANYYGRFWVPTITLADVFNQFGDQGFEFVNIDIEGGSVDTLHRLLKTESLPACICVEHDDRFKESMMAAQDRGYRLLHANGENQIFVRD